jgi:hypothetical protein
MVAQVRRERIRSLLLIGLHTLPSEGEIGNAGYHITALVDPGTPVRPGGSIVVHDTTLESAPFLPEQFDTIICARPLQSLRSPASLFEKSRLWLSAGGTLVVGGVNRSSLTGRIWRRNWLKAHAATARHLLNADNLKGYADRFGYEVKTLRTYSTMHQLAGIVSGRPAPSGVVEALLAPVALAANLLNMGDTFTAILVKGGAAVRPLPALLDQEEERSPGLAPALYTGTHRKRS